MMGRKWLDAIANHVFLPAKLPGGGNKLPIEPEIVKQVLKALERFADLVDGNLRAQVKVAEIALRRLQSTTPECRFINEDALSSMLNEVSSQGGVFPIYIMERNAAFIIQSDQTNSITFESFELSPDNSSVMSTRGRLRRQFPTSSIALPRATFETNHFKIALTETLVKMSREPAPSMLPKTRKAGADVEEIRETTNPSLVTGLLSTFLLPHGKPFPGLAFMKNTRDEVCLDRGQLHPWRRSPVWLLIRVTLQQIMWQRGSESPDRHYKAFMIFLMGQLLSEAVDASLDLDMVHTMRAKINQRQLKLRPQGNEKWLIAARRTVQLATEYIDSRLALLQKHEAERFATYKHQEFQEACLSIKLPKLDAYLQKLRSRAAQDTKGSPIKPNLTYNWDAPSHQRLPQLCSESVSPSERIQNLINLERWADTCLDQWLTAHVGFKDTCRKLRALLEQYHQRASNTYQGQPESLSSMYLTVLSLWVACDKAALMKYPLLKQYTPQIPADFWQLLQLRSQRDLERLHEAEVHLKGRNGRPIFAAHGNHASFGCRYFDSSSTHQKLRETIEAQASRDRELKRQELIRDTNEHANLCSHVQSMSCDYVVEGGGYNPKRLHAGSCLKCSLKDRAAAMTIKVHEWPLPESSASLKEVIFELQLPSEFSAWRDLTLYLITQVLPYEHSTEVWTGDQFTLKSYAGLASYYKAPNRPSDVSLASRAKPWAITHMGDVNVSVAQERNVLLKTGLQWRSHDHKMDFEISEFVRKETAYVDLIFKLPDSFGAQQHCLHQLPSSPPDSPTANHVIAEQAFCPSEISLDEYKDLVSLPLGYRIRWQNVLRQLAMPVVDWKRPATVLILWQTIHQAGPVADDYFRESRKVLQDEAFVDEALRYLAVSLGHVKENWDSSMAVAAFSSLATQLLSIGPSSREAQCFQFLQDCRSVCQDWMLSIRSNLSKVSDEKERSMWTLKQHQIALIMANCFPVDERHFELIFSDPSATADFIESSIVAQQTESTPRSSQLIIEALWFRWQRLMHYLLFKIEVWESHGGQDEPGLLLLIHSRALDHATARAWPAFRRSPAGRWRIDLNAPVWVKTQALTSNGAPLVEVRFNLRSSELLINGLPLGRLPSQFENHPTYDLLFGRHQLDCGPSCEPGMQFQAGLGYLGYDIHLAIDGEDSAPRDMYVTAGYNGSTLQFVPAWVFHSCLPTTLANDYVYWYHQEKDWIVLRTKAAPWETAESQYTLFRSDNCWKLRHCDGNILVDPVSPLGQRIASVLRPIALSLCLRIWYHTLEQAVHIEVPQYGLEFRITRASSVIESVQFPDMHIVNRPLMTLLGLRSQLQLQGAVNAKQRMVLIPEGEVTCQLGMSDDVSHVIIDVDKAATHFQAYRIREDLGLLEGNGSLQAKLFLAYLHAITSTPAADGFTAHTGFEQALSILRSENVRSFDKLSPENVAMLDNIAKLSPEWTYYPPQMKVQQRVFWSPHIRSSSQHPDLAVEVECIFRQADSNAFLYPDHQQTHPCYETRTHMLAERNAIRSSTFRTAGYGTEHFTTTYDVLYQGRHDSWNEIKHRVHETCTAMLNGRTPQLTAESPNFARDLPNFFREAKKTVRTDEGFDHRKLQYGENWLAIPLEIFPDFWCRIHGTIERDMSSINLVRFRLWVCTLAFAENAEPVLVEALAALACRPQGQFVTPIAVPNSVPLTLSYGHEASAHGLRSSVQSQTRGFKKCPDVNLPAHQGESQADAARRRHETYQRNIQSEQQRFINALQAQWPCELRALQPPAGQWTYVVVEHAMKVVRLLWQHWNNNKAFKIYLESIASRLSIVPIATRSMMPSTDLRARGVGSRECRLVTLDMIFATLVPPHAEKPTNVLQFQEVLMHTEPISATHLQSFISDSQEANTSAVRNRYFASLKESVLSLQKQKHSVLNDTVITLEPALQTYLTTTRSMVNRLFVDSTFLSMVSSGIKSAQDEHLPLLKCLAFAIAASQTPRWSQKTMLTQLNHKNVHQLPHAWKSFLKSFAQAIKRYQWSERLFASRHRPSDLLKELTNQGHRHWDSRKRLDTLLLEIEANIRVRETQREIASIMRDPPDDENAVMQLNMGEGKSSVIVPIVAASLAGTKKKRLVRVIVAKPQSRQMFDMLLSTIGGLMDRRIYHLPFSRGIQITLAQAQHLHQMCQECIETGGIMLMQPEHILSLQLMTVDSAIKGDKYLWQQLMKTRDLFINSGRDIVDESDENFSPKFELVYTMGKQQPVDFAPKRWVVIQEILDMVPVVASNVLRTSPDAIDIGTSSNGRFPHTRILKEEAKQAFVDLLATRLCEAGTPSFPVARQRENIRAAVRTYLTTLDLTQKQVGAVEKSIFWGSGTEETLLLLRGLLANGIMAFALGNKRWRVNYGPHKTRVPSTNLAVPYTAKDIPSARSEYSHPDVQIVLTCLSHYYDGLSDEELFTTIAHLQKSDQASEEYQSWTSTATAFPREFQHLKGVNLEDKVQCREAVFPHLRYLKATIDYFLSNLVFSKEMRVFPHKLSASGWDLAATKSRPLTGFSGTNDSQHLLPLGVKQLDLDSQKHTNALVLEYLLGPGNSVCMMPKFRDADGTFGKAFIQSVIEMTPDTRVILDVGAQIIDLTNEQVAREWLDLTDEKHGIQAVVYCDTNDQLCVLDRQGRTEALMVSPFSGRLDVCLVFLDEAHTRGINLRLPINYRAAVTLGADVTKDRLAQACMRMRQLGKGQTVVFCVPTEVEVKILDSRTQSDRRMPIDIPDVLRWAIGETISDLKRLMSIWANQGRAFCRHRRI